MEATKNNNRHRAEIQCQSSVTNNQMASGEALANTFNSFFLNFVLHGMHAHSVSFVLLLFTQATIKESLIFFPATSEEVLLAIMSISNSKSHIVGNLKAEPIKCEVD